jgi:hypothetical protein
MPEEEPIHLGQWFHPILNPPAWEDLARLVSDATDLEIRRRNRRAGNQYNDVSSKLMISRFHVRSVFDRITFARCNLDSMLADLATDLETNVEALRRAANKNKLVAEFRDHVLVAHLEGLLTQIKCLLDSLAQFYSIAFGRSVKTFSDKGDNVLKDLRNLGAKYGRETAAMAALIKTAKASWTDEAIAYRDELVHFGQLREFRCLHLPLSSATRYRPDQVHDSVMPNGQRTEDYLPYLLQSTHSFAAAWLAFIFGELRKRGTAEARND